MNLIYHYTGQERQIQILKAEFLMRFKKKSFSFVFFVLVECF